MKLNRLCLESNHDSIQELMTLIKNHQQGDFNLQGSKGIYPNVTYFDFIPVIKDYAAKARAGVNKLIKLNPTLKSEWLTFRDNKRKAEKAGTAMQFARFDPTNPKIPGRGPHLSNLSTELNNLLIAMEFIKWVENVTTSARISFKEVDKFLSAMRYLKAVIKAANV